MTKRKIATALIAGITVSTSAGIVQAQSTDSRPAVALEEIVVSARKREESVLDVPFAITALTAADLEASNLKDLKDVQNFTPGFFFSEFGAGRGDRGIRNFVLRGINVSAFVNANDAAIAFVDGAPVVSGEVTSFTEVERVEVLRGPQTAYFGRNTFSGAINIITKTPGDEWRGKVSAQYASPGSTDLAFTVEGPLVEGRLSARLTATHLDKKGDYTNSADGSTLGDRQTRSLAGTLYATPNEQLSIKVFGEYARFDDGTGASGRLDSVTQSNCDANGGGANNWFCGVVPDIDTTTLGSNAAIDDIFIENVIEPFSLFDNSFIKKAGLAKKNVSLHGIVQYEFADGYAFEAITAYHSSKSMIVSDESTRDTKNVPAVANPFRASSPFNFLIERDFKDFSQELRLSSPQDHSLRWTAGATYVHPKIIASSVSGELDLAQPFRQFSTFPTFTSDTYGFFGGVYYDITDDFTISAEARYQIDDVTVDVPGLEETFKSLAPRVTLEYRPNEDWNLFVNWARGYRPGAFNARLLTLAPDVAAEIVRQTGAQVGIDEESMDMYEVGAKGSFWDRRGTLSVVGYTGKISNQQITSTAFVDINNTGSISGLQVVNNAGSTDLMGVEAEAALVFPVAESDELLLNGSFAWNDVEFEEYFCSTCVLYSSTGDVAGNRFPKAPAYTATLTGTYSHPLQSGLELYGRAEYIYTGSFFATEANLARSGSANRVNLRVGLIADDWSVEGFVSNLTNDDTVLSIERQGDPRNPGRQTVAFGLPDKRNYGIRVKYEF
ncbi:MAG: TonB-dependent receptor [Rhodospirillaceae bacterium]